jgi:predicted nucleotide-binding protein (sugar kinase/HSP70/actin superfamily)
MWRILIGGALGFGLAKLLQVKSNSKESVSKPSQTEKKMTWKEEVISAVDKEGIEYAFDGYSAWDESKFNNPQFQKAIKSYVTAKQSLENYIANMKDVKAKDNLESTIDKEGLDYAMNGYSDWEQYYDYESKKRKPLKDVVFHSKRKKYIQTRNSLIKSLGLDPKEY